MKWFPQRHVDVMSANPDSKALDQLIEAAYRQTLARFESEVESGNRDSTAELADYRRQRRDYASLLRSGRIPEEAHALAEKLLQTHNLSVEGAFRFEFEQNLTRMLIRLYDAFASHTEKRYGNR